MAVIFSALVYVFIDTKSAQTVKATKRPEIKANEPIAIEEEDEVGGIQVIEITGQVSEENITEATPKRIKRLDSDESDRSPDSQKLVLFPSKSLKPPKFLDRRRFVNIPSNHKMSSRLSEPRPFNYMTNGVRPNGFQSPARSTARSYYEAVDNIQDVVQQPTYQLQSGRTSLRPVRAGVLYTPMESSSIIPVKLAGTYRHPRDNIELSNMFNIKEYSPVPSAQPEVVDPFYNYKPRSPLEINQMVTRGMKLIETTPSQSPYFRRRFRHQIASIPHYNIPARDVTNIYQNVLSSGAKYQLNRNSELGQKPLSMVLDFLPMASDQMAIQTQPIPTYQQLPRPTRVKPFQTYYQDTNYFNSMQFPQLMPQNPRFQMHKPQAANVQSVGMTKPSQLVVHLNLFPKNKQVKRSSFEEEMENREVKNPQKGKTQLFSEVSKNNTIDTTTSPFNINFNLNTNGHPENIFHQYNYQPTSNSTTEPASNAYYYDEADDDDGLFAAPSLVYKNIHRDRPIHLMLKNSTKKEHAMKKLKNHKQDYQQTIEKPTKPETRTELKHGRNVFQ